MEKEIYLAGGCYWGVEKYVQGICGVIRTEVGFANGHTIAPSYRQVCSEDTGHAETVHVVYDPTILPLKVLLQLFFRIIDPLSVDRQGGDVGHQYRTGIYFVEDADGRTAREALDALERRLGEQVAVECVPLDRFWPAEEYHQKYLDKHPGGYCHVPLEEIEWVRSVKPATFLEQDNE